MYENFEYYEEQAQALWTAMSMMFLAHEETIMLQRHKIEELNIEILQWSKTCKSEKDRAEKYATRLRNMGAAI